MRKMYCYSCGVSISYKAKKPMFCQSCGESLGSTARRQEQVQEREDAVDEDEIYWSKDQLTQSELEVDIDIHPKGETFAQIGKVEGYKPLPRVNVPLPPGSSENIMDEFAREAGAKSARGEKGRPTPKGKRKRKPKNT